MRLKDFYREVVNRGIQVDVRGKQTIEVLLKDAKARYDKLSKSEQEVFDQDVLINPFSDTRILCGDTNQEIKSVIVGIDVEGSELLLVDRLKAQGDIIDLVISHHPEGMAYANFYEVMDLQVDVFAGEGVSLSAAEGLLAERKQQVARRVHAANHQRSVDIAKLLKLNFLCMHTPCDNLACDYMCKLIDKEKPDTLGKLMKIIEAIPEYKAAAKGNNPPKLVIGDKSSRCRKIHVEFTGGTEGPKNIYEKLSACGIDTVVAMHQSEEHYEKCKSANINVIFASHIASDNLGVNLMLDHLESKGKLKVQEFSGFRRVSRKK